mgnify:CR=1 FL=1
MVVVGRNAIIHGKLLNFNVLSLGSTPTKFKKIRQHMNFNLSSHATLTGVFFVALVPNLNAALASIDLTPNVAASAAPFHSSNFANTTSDTFAYDPGNPTAVLPTTVWSSATHFHQGN